MVTEVHDFGPHTLTAQPKSDGTSPDSLILAKGSRFVFLPLKASKDVIWRPSKGATRVKVDWDFDKLPVMDGDGDGVIEVKQPEDFMMVRFDCKPAES